MANPLTVQKGGTHYKTMAIQPVEFGFANRYDNCVFSTMKYVSRHRSKNGALDLDKAIHFIELRVEMIERHGLPLPAENTIPVERYIAENGIPEFESSILTQLHCWASDDLPDGLTDAEIGALICGDLRRLKDHAYPDHED